MKHAAVFLSFALLFSCRTTSSVLVSSGQSLELAYVDYDVSNVAINNTSLRQIDVSVISNETGEQIRGFGLGPSANANVIVESENRLVLTNNTKTTTKVKLRVEKSEREIPTSGKLYRSFSLLNNSAKSIPLIIPTVMNPNLSPFSKSGVDLKLGQEIFFKHRGKKHILLTVTESIQDGDAIAVSKLIRERKEILGLN